jgi:hypothetical protein
MSYEELDLAVLSYMEKNELYGRVFNIGEGAVTFPAVNYTISKMDKDAALKIIVTKLDLLPDNLISAEDNNKMIEAVIKIYPDIFKK